MAQYDETALGLELPWPDNPAREDIGRIRAALQLVDSLIGDLQSSDDDFTAALAAEVTNRNNAITTAINNLIGGAPGALNTLDELAAAINDDASYAASIVTLLAGKAPTVHDHDSRYYTETEIDALLLPISSGWVQIGSTVTIGSPVASVDFTSGLTASKELLIEIVNVQHNSGSNQGLEIAVSQNAGSSWSPSIAIGSASIAAGVSISGALAMLGRDRDFSILRGGASGSLAELGSTGVLNAGVIRHTGGFNAIRVRASGNSLSAGSIKLSGR